MPATTSPHGIQYPIATDLIKDTSVAAKLAEDMKNLALTTNAAITFAGFIKDPVPANIDFNTLTVAGAYPIPYSTNPNGPGAVGLLIVGESANPSLDIITQMVVTETKGVMSRSVRNGVWRDWSAGSDSALPVADAGSWNAASVPTGVYPAPYNDSLTGRPLDTPGNLLSFSAGHPSIQFEQQLYLGAAGSGAYYRTGRDKTFGAWSEVGVPDGGMDKGAGYRAALVSAFRARRGGTIGTDGKGVVALRFDHHLNQFRDTILPLLQERGLPWAQAINPANLGTGNDTMTYAQIETMCLENGGEVWNHGRNHGDAPSIDAGRREIVQSLTELRAGMPSLAIEGFMPPGVADGGYLGASPFRTPEQWATPLGRMIMANHAAVSGYMGGWYRTLDGQINVGMGHRTMDTAQAYHWTASIDAAAEQGMGVTFMVHPNYVGQPGYTTLAALTAGLDRIAQARDEGRIEVLTPSALLLADIGSTFRRNLLRTGDDVTDGWSETVDLTQPDQRGAVHEVVAELTGTGDATLTVTEGTRISLSQTVTLPGTARIPFTIPLDATSVTVAVSGATSGSVVLRST